MGYRYREARAADSEAVHRVFYETINGIDRRFGNPDATPPGNEAAVARNWARRQGLFDHLARTGDAWWLAEDDGGRIVGYARSIMRDGTRELTEFFVLSEHQGGGLGRELLGRVFAAEGASHRTIVATLEPAALARYLKSGVLARLLLAYIAWAPTATAVASDLEAMAMDGSPEMGAALAGIDRQLLGHTRAEDHAWLQADRQGRLYRRAGVPVGYGYTGLEQGPFAALEAGDLPAILADAETRAAGAGAEAFGIWAPLVNAAALEHAFARGGRIDPFLAVFMSDAPRLDGERYLITNPPFFV